MQNPLKTRMINRQATRGFWLEAAQPTMAEAATQAGHRFLLIDNEHSPASLNCTLHMMRAIKAADGHPMARVAGNDPVALKFLLDLGMTSIMIPQINTADEARAAIAACRYPPRGTRGFAGDIRASRFGQDSDYAQTAHESLFLMLQIESVQAVDNIEDIARVDGLDMLFVGPYDLSGTLGHLGETDHPLVEEAIARVETVARSLDVPLGTVPRAGKTVRDLLDGAYDLVIGGSELGMMIAAIKDDLAAGDEHWLGV